MKTTTEKGHLTPYKPWKDLTEPEAKARRRARNRLRKRRALLAARKGPATRPTLKEKRRMVKLVSKIAREHRTARRQSLSQELKILQAFVAGKRQS